MNIRDIAGSKENMFGSDILVFCKSLNLLEDTKL